MRTINNSLAFSTLATEVHNVNTWGSPNIKMHGKLYHKIAYNVPQPGVSPKGSEIYFYDSAFQ